jgi:hypothetical protein
MSKKRELRPVGEEETYTVKVRRDPETGVVVRELWTKNGQAYCEHGPASISRDPITGV